LTWQNLSCEQVFDFKLDGTLTRNGKCYFPY